MIKSIPYRFSKILFSKTPIRSKLFRLLLKHLSFVPYNYRVMFGAVARSHYAYCILNSLRLAKTLGYKKVSIIEFGVAEGNGLLNIEQHVRESQKILDIEVEIYGFDRGIGLPKPKDYKDLPYLWKEGHYKMDVSKLKKILKTSKLVLGDIKKTLKTFKCAPIACILFDLDLYSSTVDAFGIFKKPHIPRVFCYFDDVFGSNTALLNEYTGELRAINEFNERNQMKLARLREVYTYEQSEDHTYQQSIFILHDFKHLKYNTYVNFQDDGSITNLE